MSLRVLLYTLVKVGQTMLDDNKERCIVFWFCILLVIIGIVFAKITGNQWWLALLVGPFSIIVAAIYAKKGDKK